MSARQRTCARRQRDRRTPARGLRRRADASRWRRAPPAAPAASWRASSCTCAARASSHGARRATRCSLHDRRGAQDAAGSALHGLRATRAARSPLSRRRTAPGPTDGPRSVPRPPLGRGLRPPSTRFERNRNSRGVCGDPCRFVPGRHGAASGAALLEERVLVPVRRRAAAEEPELLVAGADLVPRARRDQDRVARARPSRARRPPPSRRTPRAARTAPPSRRGSAARSPPGASVASARLWLRAPPASASSSTRIVDPSAVVNGSASARERTCH